MRDLLISMLYTYLLVELNNHNLKVYTFIPFQPTAVAVPGAGSGCSGNYEGHRSLRIMLCSCAYLVNDVLGLGSHVVNDGATLACS